MRTLFFYAKFTSILFSLSSEISTEWYKYIFHTLHNHLFFFFPLFFAFLPFLPLYIDMLLFNSFLHLSKVFLRILLHPARILTHFASLPPSPTHLTRPRPPHPPLHQHSFLHTSPPLTFSSIFPSSQCRLPALTYFLYCFSSFHFYIFSDSALNIQWYLLIPHS